LRLDPVKADFFGAWVAGVTADSWSERLASTPRGKLRVRFWAAEWSKDRIHDRYMVRIAAADLPTSLWDEVIAAVAAWWKARERRVRLSPQNVGKAAEGASVQ